MFLIMETVTVADKMRAENLEIPMEERNKERKNKSRNIVKEKRCMLRFTIIRVQKQLNSTRYIELHVSTYFGSSSGPKLPFKAY